MNERIEKLAVQARAETYAHFDDETFDWDVWHTVFQHKFAELIVRECIDIAEQTRYDGKIVAERIKFVFGVEE